MKIGNILPYSVLTVGLLTTTVASALFNPLSIVGRVISTTLDVRTRSEVKNDAEIFALANKRLLENKRAEWNGVTLLVFAQRVVLVGAVKSDEAKRIIEQVVREDHRIRALTNDLIVIGNEGDKGNLIRDTAIDAAINAELTATKGVSSVNMRWKSVNGNVVIMGVAQSQSEARLAISKIRKVDGVKHIKSHLIVEPKM